MLPALLYVLYVLFPRDFCSARKVRLKRPGHTPMVLQAVQECKPCKACGRAKSCAWSMPIVSAAYCQGLQAFQRSSELVKCRRH